MFKSKTCCYLLAIIACLFAGPAQSQNRLDSLLPVRGLAIAAPPSSYVDSFNLFIEKELAPRQVNVLILRVDFNYRYTSHPELSDSNALTYQQVKSIVEVCKKNQIRLIPQINLLGHQSWANRTNKLLQVYPQFDETPGVKMPAEYKWPNEDSLYCKSYCPLHPEVHKVVFALVDEIVDAFEAKAFHAGMDEVFYIGHPDCPRCRGKDKAALFAGEVSKIRNHLAAKGMELWIWGDRLIDGHTTGIGMWEGSYNDTHPAIDMIPKDVVICDWHYERADKTAVYFAMKGFRVATCPWRTPLLAIRQLQDMISFRTESSRQMRPRFIGMVQTVWSPSPGFIRDFYSRKQDPVRGNDTPHETFRQLFAEMGKYR